MAKPHNMGMKSLIQRLSKPASGLWLNGGRVALLAWLPLILGTHTVP
jgi:hypothetical protein